jgi:hypothetical protein
VKFAFESKEANMTSMTKFLTRSGAVALCAGLALSAMSEGASARWGGCWGCGAFAAGAIAGAALSRPYYAPRYYAPPVVVAPAPVYPAYPAYPACPLVGPLPWYCR